MKAKGKKATACRYRFPDGSLPRESDKWRFARDGVSPSYINTFLGCRESFRLQMVEGWQSKEYDFPIEFGHLMHALHERRCRTGNEIDKIDQLIKGYKLQIADRSRLWTPADRENQEVGYAMARVIWPIYCDYYKKDLKRSWQIWEEPLRVEYEFTIAGRTVKTVLRGKLDGGWEERVKFWLHEMKSKGNIDPRKTENMLHLDIQVMTYLLMALILDFGPIEGCEYDLVRRPGTFPRKKEDITSYQKRLRREVLMNPDYYMTRVPLYVNDREIRAWETTVLQPILFEIYRWTTGESPHFVTPGYLVARPYANDLAGLICQGDKTGLKTGDPFDHHFR